MEWQHIIFSSERWYIPETKNGTPQLALLVKDALDILKEHHKNKKDLWVFPCPKSALGHLDVRFHDL